MKANLLFSSLTIWAAGAFAADGAADFEREIRPLLDEFCLKCHSTAEQKGDFDLEAHASIAAMKKRAAKLVYGSSRMAEKQYLTW